MSKKVELSAEERAQLVRRMLSKRSRRYRSRRVQGLPGRRCIGGVMNLSVPASKRLMESVLRKAQAKERARLTAQLAERDQVIGELTIATAF